MELSLCVPVWFIELHLSLAMLQKLPESEMCAWWCLCAYNLCVLVVVFEHVLYRLCVCVCCSPVLSEWSQVGDLQCVCIWLIVFLVHNSPWLFTSIVLHHLAKGKCVSTALLLCFTLIIDVCRQQKRTLTCPSTIHLDMDVLPSEPGRNRSVAARGLMLEMTKLEGARGSSANEQEEQNFTQSCKKPLNL